MASNRKTPPQRSRPARKEPRKTVPVAYMRDLASDGIRQVPVSDIPDASDYVTDKAGAAAAMESGGQRAAARAYRRTDAVEDGTITVSPKEHVRVSGGFKRVDAALLLNDLIEIHDSSYISYADGFTRGNKAQGDSGNINGAIGRELRPGFVAFLTRRIEGGDTDDTASQVVLAILDALYAAGPLEQKWATAVLLRLRWGLTHEQIAEDMAVERTTVTRYLQGGAEWIQDYIATQAWIQAYLYDDAAPRYHIDPYMTTGEMIASLMREAS